MKRYCLRSGEEVTAEQFFSDVTPWPASIEVSPTKGVYWCKVAAGYQTIRSGDIVVTDAQHQAWVVPRDTFGRFFLCLEDIVQAQ